MGIDFTKTESVKNYLIVLRFLIPSNDNQVRVMLTKEKYLNIQ